MANYAIDPSLLTPYIPAGTELDIWQGTCYASLVGFMFVNTRIKGIAFPFHTNFQEVNLRFYVRYKEEEIWKRGVVFISEIVPRPAITFIANTLYGEKYETMRMSHTWETDSNRIAVVYRWKKKSWNSFRVSAAAIPQVIPEGSEAEFITEHYWGYSRITPTRTTQYEVVHPRWMTYTVTDYATDVDFADVYGPRFSFLAGQKPLSVLLAEGSEVAIRAGRKMLH